MIKLNATNGVNDFKLLQKNLVALEEPELKEDELPSVPRNREVTASVSEYIDQYDKPVDIDTGNGQVKSYSELQEELNNYVENSRANVPEFDNAYDKIVYYQEYNDTCINYYSQMMEAFDATEDDKAYCKRMINEHIHDKNNLFVDLNNLSQKQGVSTESFQDVFNEFRSNVPDMTMTVDEKQLAISYIDRMLSCEDIPDDIRTYWLDKKAVIQEEINQIQQTNTASSEGAKNYSELQEELNNYVENSRVNAPEFNSIYDRVVYYQEYNDVCINYYTQMMEAPDATDKEKTYCKRMINEHLRDKNNQSIDLNNWLKEQGSNTESFDDVYNEFMSVVPDSTKTVSQKRLAISYIDRMLSCDDITDELKDYWTDKKEVIQQEIDNIKQKKNQKHLNNQQVR